MPSRGDECDSKVTLHPLMTLLSQNTGHLHVFTKEVHNLPHLLKTQMWEVNSEDSDGDRCPRTSGIQFQLDKREYLSTNISEKKSNENFFQCHLKSVQTPIHKIFGRSPKRRKRASAWEERSVVGIIFLDSFKANFAQKQKQSDE